MAATLEKCVVEIRDYQKQARDSKKAFRPKWPMIVLRTPKGWTAPRKINGHLVEGFWRAHQIPITDVLTNEGSLRILEDWMRSYKPDELFKDGKLAPELRALAPEGKRRMSANPVANGGVLYKALSLPKYEDYALEVPKPGNTSGESMKNFAKYLTDVIAKNMQTFRLMGPDETERFVESHSTCSIC